VRTDGSVALVSETAAYGPCGLVIAGDGQADRFDPLKEPELDPPAVADGAPCGRRDRATVWRVRPELIVAILLLLFGSGFGATLWRNRRRIRVIIEHEAHNGEYGATVVVTNCGERNEYVCAVALHGKPETKPGWSVTDIEDDANEDLPARGRPVRVVLPLPDQWIEERVPFRAAVILSSHQRPIRSRKYRPDEGVINVIRPDLADASPARGLLDRVRRR
jgi:hypothetical protein